MPYPLRFYLYLFVANVAVFLAAKWLSPYGLGSNPALSLGAAYVVILIRRRVLGRKNL